MNFWSFCFHLLSASRPGLWGVRDGTQSLTDAEQALYQREDIQPQPPDAASRPSQSSYRSDLHFCMFTPNLSCLFYPPLQSPLTFRFYVFPKIASAKLLNLHIASQNELGLSTAFDALNSSSVLEQTASQPLSAWHTFPMQSPFLKVLRCHILPHSFSTRHPGLPSILPVH